MSALVWVLIVTGGLAQAKPTQLLLDLTTPQVKQMEQSKTIGCGSGGGVAISGVPFRRPQLTLALEIAWLNEDHFELGDEVAYEVRLTNTGDRPLALPWNPDSDIVYGKDCRGLGRPKPPVSLIGSVSLKLVDSEGRGQFVGGDMLFALRDDPATYRLLAPGQSARIRVSGNIYVPRVPRSSSAASVTNHFKVIAVFDLSDSSLPNPYQTVTSADHKDVTVNRM